MIVKSNNSTLVFVLGRWCWTAEREYGR